MDSRYRPPAPMMWPPNPRAPWYNAGQKTTRFSTAHPRPSQPPSIDREQSIATDASKNASPAHSLSVPEVTAGPSSVNASPSAPASTEQSNTTKRCSPSHQPSEVTLHTAEGSICARQSQSHQIPKLLPPLLCATDGSSGAPQSHSDQTPSLPPPLPCTTDGSSGAHQSKSDQTPTLLPLLPCNGSSGARQYQSDQTPALPPPMLCATDGSSGAHQSRSNQSPKLPPPVLRTTDASKGAHGSQSDQTPTWPPPLLCTTDVSSNRPDQRSTSLLPLPTPSKTDGWDSTTDSSTNIVSSSKSMTMTELSAEIPSQAAMYMGKVWSKACGLSSSSPLLSTDEQATSILKCQILKNIHRLSLRAAYVRLWRIMPPLDTEDPGTGVGEFLRLRNRVCPRKSIRERKNTQPNNCGNHTVVRSRNGISHCSVRDVPVDVMTERRSLRDLLMSSQSDDEDGDDNSNDTFLPGVQMGLPNTQLSPTNFPFRSVNEGGDGEGNDASVHRRTNILLEFETQCHLQAARLSHSDNDCIGGNSDYPSFHSARDFSMGTTTPCSLPALSPQPSDKDGSSSTGKGSDTSFPGGSRDIPTWPATPFPIHAASFPHSHLARPGEGENLPHPSGGRGSLVGPANLLPLQAMPTDQYEKRRRGSDGTNSSSSSFSHKNVHVSRSARTKSKRRQLPKLSEASFTRSGPSRPSGASMSPSSKRDLASAQRAKPHRGNHTDPMYEGTAGLLADRRKAFRDTKQVLEFATIQTIGTVQPNLQPKIALSSEIIADGITNQTLDWLHEEYELLTDMLYYTEEEWAKVDVISKVYENQIKFSPKSANEADEKNEEEVAALQLKVGTDLILAAMEKLKETHSGRKVLRSMAQRFSQDEDEQPILESSKQNEAMSEKEVNALKMVVESVKDQLAGALEKLQESEYEARVLRSTMQRFVLTEEEMEEVVLKRCWLARYWGLAVQYVFPRIQKVKLTEEQEAAPPLRHTNT
ncbi:hypothetical protein ACLOJK_002209 [Asimina triloba]